MKYISLPVHTNTVCNILLVFAVASTCYSTISVSIIFAFLTLFLTTEYDNTNILISYQEAAQINFLCKQYNQQGMLISTKVEVYLKLETTLPITQLTINLASYNSSSISYNGFSSLVLVVCFIPEVIPYFSGWGVGGWLQKLRI